MAVRIQFRRGTAAEWTSANPTLAAGELGYETDTAKFKLGDGTTAWTSLSYGGINQADIDAAIANVIDAAPGALDTLNELAAAINDDANFFSTISNNIANAQANAQTYAYDLQVEHSSQTTNVHGIDNAANLVYASQIADFATEIYVSNAISDHDQATTNVHGIANTQLLMTQDEIANAIDNALSVHESDTTSVHGIANTAELATSTDVDTAISTHNSDTTDVHGIANTALLALGTDIDNAIVTHSAITTNVHGIADTAELATQTFVSNTIATELVDYATLSGPTFTGTVTLPTSTSIGDVDSTEIGYLNGVTSAIQSQLDAKLATTTAASTYAPLSGPTFTGNVVLPSTTSIGDVSATEISYLNNVSSAIQTQLDAKLASATAANTYAPIDSPTFTTSATLPAQTDIGNVTSTELSYVEGVTSSIQTQLNAKAPLAGATFTGSVEVPDITVTGNLYVQGSTTTISTSDLKVRDNMIYLNQAGLFDLSGAVGDGTNVVYTTSSNHDFSAGDYVTVANTTPSSFDVNGSGVEILAVTANTFTVASTVTDTYVSGGTARGKSHANPDLGWAAGRYADNTYAHAGLFRDASDGVFKMFDGYVPEPDESVFIDTSDNTFALAPLAVSEITAANVVATTGVVFPDNTIQTSAGVPSLTGFTEKTASYTLDTLDHQDNVVEMNSGSAVTFTIPTNASLAWPIGASMDIIQTGTGQVTIANAAGVTLNFTPGNKLRTQWSSCTIMKRGTDSWILYGDLTA